MGLPERMPEPEDFEARPEPARPSAADRPDWLVGAEEGVQSEYQRSPRPAPEPKLVRPAPPPEAPAALPAGDPPALVRPDAGTPPGLPLASRATAGPAPARPVAWSAAGSSVPKLAQKPQAAPAPPEDEPVTGAFDATPPADHTPLGIEDERLAHRMPAALDEPWWMVIGERLATDRKLQLLMLGAIATIVAAVVFWPRPNAGVAVGEIRRHPDEWEGRAVRVSGRVGEVFSIGQGVVYHLHQGRDTIVVFSRAAAPTPRRHVAVDGVVSTGYLDGAARVAILENAGP